MSEETMSPADLMAIMNNGNGMNGNNMWNNPFMYLIWLAMFGNGGFGFGNNGAAAAVSRAELADGLNNQTVLNDLRNIDTGISGVNFESQKTANTIAQQLCSGFGGVNLNTANGFNNVGMSILNNSNGIVSAINQASAAQQVANCGISHAIQDNKYEMVQNTNTITDAVHKEGELTRKTLMEQQIQELRDSRENVQRELQSAQITLANANQTQNILGSLGRYVAYTGCGSNCCGNGF